MNVPGRIIRWIAIALIIGAIAWQVSGSGSGLKLGSVAPDFEAQVLDGEAFSLADAHGKVVVLDFWATWCPPCKVSLPAIERVHRRYADDDDVVVLTVNTDGPMARVAGGVRQFMKRSRYSFPVAFDTPKQLISRMYQVTAIPTMVVVDSAGKVSFSHTGLNSNDPKVIEKYIVEAIESARGG